MSVTIKDAPTCLNINDQTMWVLGYNEAVDRLKAQPVKQAKPACKECAKWRQEQADNKEWIEGVAEGRAVVEKLAAKAMRTGGAV